MRRSLRPLLPHLVGLASMSAGSVAVVVLVGLLNRPAPPATQREAARETAFVVEDRPRPPDPPKTRRPPARRARPKSGPRPAPPRVGSALSDVPLGGLPLLEPTAVSDPDESLLGDTRDVVMTSETVDVPPRPLERPAPEIPMRLRAQGARGRVVLNLLIGSDGRVARTRTLSSTPPGVFDDVAIAAVKRWRFSPARYRGEPVPVWGRQVLEFGGS